MGCRCFIFRVLEGICRYLRSGGLLLPGVILGLSPTLAPSGVPWGRGQRADPCTHTLQQLFLIWNTFSIKDTPSVQLTNGYTGILETAEFYTHDCTGHQWLGSLECSIDFHTLCLLQKMALESFLPLQGQFSLCCRQTRVDSKYLLSLPLALGKGAMVKLRGDRSSCTAARWHSRAGRALWGGTGYQPCCKNTLYRLRLYRYRNADTTPAGPCYSLHQLLTPCHSWAGDTAGDRRTHPSPSHAPQQPELEGRAFVFSCS